jgi:hypothetical protein
VNFHVYSSLAGPVSLSLLVARYYAYSKLQLNQIIIFSVKVRPCAALKEKNTVVS